MWMRIALFLLICAAVAGAAGAWLGHSLVQSAPAFETRDEERDEIQRLADVGVPEAPQPRVDGTLGVPARQDHDGLPALVSALDGPDPGIALSTVEAPPPETLAARRPADPARTSIPGLGDESPFGHGQRVNPADLPPELAFAVALPADAPASDSRSWQDHLNAALAECDTRGFFGRFGCHDNVREQYCTPHDAWGKVAACPTNLRPGG